MSNEKPIQNSAITFADDAKLPTVAHKDGIRRMSTAQSSDFDTKSVRSMVLKKMNFIKRKKKPSVRAEGPPYHTMPLEEVFSLLHADPEDGLSENEVLARRAESGYNEMEGEGGVSPIKLLIKQLLNVMVLILLIAMIVSFVFKDYIEGGVICAIMILNAVVGFLQEFKAEKTMESLRQMASPTVCVIRDGQQETISTRELVPGDTLVMKSGDVVGADCRITEAFNMDVDEALLTGESLPVNKSVDIIEGAQTSLGDRTNMAYSSTTLTKGRGKAIVTAIGMQTEIGKIAKRLLDNSGNTKTPLQKSLDRMALVLLAVAIVCIIIVFSVSKFHIDDQQILYAISTAIGVIPEGLVAVVTLTQAFGVHSMAKAKALVRRMAALEMLGAVTNVCSDKTGTLTQSKMALTRLWRPSEGFYSVSGIGFVPEGQVTSEEDETKTVTQDNMSFGFQNLVYNAALCNMSEVRKDKSTEEWHGIGDPTEIALQVFAHKLDAGKPNLTQSEENRNAWKVMAEYPFDSSIKRMSMICKNPKGNDIAFMKGATERVLSCCIGVQNSNENEIQTMSVDELGKLILPQVEALARGGLRVLSLAMRKLKLESQDMQHNAPSREFVEQDMVFLGLVGIYDPPRLESKEAVERCHRAGISVHMLTGDHIATATAIAREVGIIPSTQDLPDSHGTDDTASGRGNLVMAATEFDELSEEAIDRMEDLPLVIARCSPDTKVKMIEALHRRKRITGMTGDGVNDSPSLKESDIGIAMGLNGSDVAKQASDIVLVDDNFATIVSAIEEGRRVFANISRFVVHMVSVNVAEVTPLLLGLAFVADNGDSVFPLSPIQILFNNIITSSPPAMSLGLEPVHPEQMLVPPRPTDEGLFSYSNVIDILFYGIMMGLICLANFVVVIYGKGTGNLGIDCNAEYNDSCYEVFRARGALFVTMTVLLLVHGYTCRNLKGPAWSWKALTSKQNYYLHGSVVFGIAVMLIVVYVPVLNTRVFKHAPIDWEWGMVAASTLLYIALAEGWKYLKRKVILYWERRRP